MGPLEALIHAVGIEIQEGYGRPAFAVAQDFVPGDASLYLSSVLALPSRGWLWVGGSLVRYVAVDSGVSTSVQTPTVLDRTIPRGSPVVLDTRRIHPDSYELFWPRQPVTYDHYDNWP